MKKLLLVDAYAIIFRAYYAMIRAPRVTGTGMNTGAIFGFVNVLEELLKSQSPSHIAVCFDPGGLTFRHEVYPAYKENRERTPEDIVRAVPYIKRILAARNIAVVTSPGYEADDVIGTLARRAAAEGYEAVIVTGDKDLAQLVAPHVTLYNPAKDEHLDVEGVNAKFGINNPSQVIDLLGLMGDSADNIPGCPGVGPKKAQKLIADWGCVESVILHAGDLKGALATAIRENAQQIMLSKQLATINTAVPIDLNLETTSLQAIDVEELRRIYTELEFRTFLARLDQEPQPTDTPVAPAAMRNEPRVGSLFDDIDVETTTDNTAKPNSTVSHDNRPTAINDDVVIVNDSADVAALAATLAASEEDVAVFILSNGDEAMRAETEGLALARGKEAWYIPFDSSGIVQSAVAPLFTGRATIVAPDIKWLMVVLGAAKMEFTAPYYDTAVAHYLLQPERSHSTRSMAFDMMHIDLPETMSIARGRAPKWNDVPVETEAKYAGLMARTTLALRPVLDEAIVAEGIRNLLTDIELPLIRVLADMELAGARIDCNALNEYAKTLSRRAATLETECHELAGASFNTASPAQVGEVLFGTLHLDDKAKRTRSGQYSTTEEILVKLRHRHPIVDKILELRGVRKLLNTYVTVLPGLVNKHTGRVHTTFNQTVTATGRLSSTNPNLQNIPVRTDEGREIRRAFIPAEGNVFFSADYSQIELRLVADLSGDPTMLSAFEQDSDIHALTAARIYHEPIEAVTPEQRRKAKTANFGILYGISAFGLAERLGISRAEAKQLIDGYYAVFPRVREYIDETIEKARANGYVTTLYGRRRMLPDINSRNAVVRGFSERNAVNAPVQGTAADVIKRAMVAIAKRFKQEGLSSRMILQVHDELNFDVVPSELERVEQIVVSEMETAYNGRVRLTASHAAADNWLDAH